MTIAKSEAALVKLAADCLTTVDVASGPGALDGGYITRLLANLPTVRVVFLGGDDPQTASSFLNIDAAWAVLVFTGWQGGDERSRRIGVDAAYAILARLAPIYHNVLLKDETGEGISRVSVTGIENLWSSSWDLVNAAVFSLGLESELVLDISDQDLKARLDDFRTAGVTFDVDDPAEDLDGTFKLPQ